MEDSGKEWGNKEPIVLKSKEGAFKDRSGWTLRGTWSEVGQVREERLEFGRAMFQSWLKKTQSIRARVEFSLLLDQV